MTTNLPTTIRERMKTTAMPIVYEEACKALAACRTLDEAKYFSDKSDVLAAWAKIYKSDQAALESRRLKLHAYRRMSELADELRPNTRPIPDRGQQPGPVSLLMTQGFSKSQTGTIRRVGSIPEKEFQKIIGAPHCPSPLMINAVRKTGSDSWKALRHVSSGIGDFRSFCRRHPAKAFAHDLLPDEAIKARELVREIQDWLDEFEQHLPKGDA